MLHAHEPYWWYTPNTNWTQAIIDHPDAKYPYANQLLFSVWVAIALSILRIICDYFVFIPWGERVLKLSRNDWCDVVDVEEASWIKKLEPLFRNSHDLREPKQAIIEKDVPRVGSAKEKGIVTDSLRVQQQRTQNRQHNHHQMMKYINHWWCFLSYTIECIIGLWALCDKRWFADMCDTCWGDNFPYHEVSDDVRYYLLLSLGFYSHDFIFLLIRERRNDSMEMIVHHMIAVLLICMGWVFNTVRMASIVLLLHDISDPVLEASKLFHYAKWQSAANGVFIGFGIIFAVSHLYMFPYYVMESLLIKSRQAYTQVNLPYVMYNTLAFALLFLHIYWMYCILRLGYRFIAFGTPSPSSAAAASAIPSNECAINNKQKEA